MVTSTETQNSLADTVSTVKILVADDHEVMRLGMRNLLEAQSHWEVCAEASNGKEAVQMADDCHPDVVILDITMPTMNGLEAADHIAAAHPQLPIILFSLHLAGDMVNPLHCPNIRGAVSKSEAGRDLVDAVQTVLDGGTFFRGKKSLPSAAN